MKLEVAIICVVYSLHTVSSTLWYHDTLIVAYALYLYILLCERCSHVHWQGVMLESTFHLSLLLMYAIQ